ncbi:hypothetical protein D915_010692 [Fasciola hepatica]|uniref:GOLD domain-containing protein n=1 Tax=Fasciola hepatica TaxID=6192 RepID=A0A4E0QUM5_FASHE|nr:hypothetical protein D915_010692 [Fasciola hepatica]
MSPVNRQVPLLLFALLCLPSLGLRFNLQAGGKKCLKDYSPGGVITKGEYSASKHDVLTSTILILDSRGHLLYKREGFENGSFSFSTEDYELVDMCFEVRAKHPGQHPDSAEIFLDIKQGAEAKRFDLVSTFFCLFRSVGKCREPETG